MEIIPFDDRDGTIWLNGEMIPWREAKTHTLSHGLHYASLVFEGERSYNGRIFENEWHTKRLRESGRILDFDLPYSDEESWKRSVPCLMPMVLSTAMSAPAPGAAAR